MTFILTKMLFKKIIIGIPSYNEQDSIAFVVEQIDKGIQKFYNPTECLIVNIDSDSTDNTKNTFLKTRAQTSKKYINTGNRPRGKGKNLLKFFQLCQELNAKYMATVDGDIKTINPTWTQSLLDPLIRGGFDYCVPMYSRNRFEGNITNHFAYPLIYAIYGARVRQPIGGDFGVSRRLCDYLLKQPTHPTTLKFGIDIFMTCHAISGGFNLKQIYLGKKFHRPSFYHMISTFQNVFESGIYVTKQHKINERNYSLGKFEIDKQKEYGIDDIKYYPHKTAIPDLLKSSAQIFWNHHNEYKNYLCRNTLKLITTIVKTEKPILSADIWTDILASFLGAYYKKDFNIKKLSLITKLITPIYLWRAASFWEEVEFATSKCAENKINNQASLLKMKMAK